MATFASEFPVYGLVGLVTAAGVVAVLVARLAHALWLDRRLRERAVHSRVLQDLLDQLEQRPTLAIRRALSRAEFLRDVASVDAWLDSRGRDESFADPELVARQRHGMRQRNRWPMRAASAGLLGWTECPDAAPALIRVMAVPTEPALLRQVARRSLDRIHHPRVIEVLFDELENLRDAERAIAIERIAGFGNTAVEKLDPIWKAPNSASAVRRRVAHLLGQIPTAQAMSLVVDALADDDAEVRIEAVQSLAHHSDPRIVEKLLRILLDDESAIVRTTSTRVLVKSHAEEVLDFLHRACLVGSREVRLRVIENLRECGVRSRTLLMAILLDPDREIARTAAEALDQIGAVREAIGALQEKGYDAPANELLIDIGRAGHLEPVLSALADPDDRALLALVRILARVADPRASEHLVPLLDRKPVGRLHSRVVDALRASGDGSQTLRLLPLLDSPDEWLRKSVVDYLGAFGDEEIKDSILPVASDPNPWVRESALHVLEQLRPELDQAQAVMHGLEDEYDFVRAAAIRCLCAMGAFDVLFESGVLELVAEPRIRDALLQGLRRHAPVQAMPMITRLAAFCSDQDLDLLRHAAGRAVDELDEPEVDLLMFSYASPTEDASSRWFATVGWCRASAQAADEWRDELLSDPDPKIRASMAVALSEREVNRNDATIALYRLLTDPAPIVVRGALYSAACLGLHELESALVDARSHDDEDVRVDATLALSILPGDAHGRDHFDVTDLRRRQIIASTAARLHRMQASAIVDWVRHLRSNLDRTIIGSWVDHEHPLFRYVLNRARDRDDIASRVLLCRTPFEAERVLLHELMANEDPGERLCALKACIALDTRRCYGRILAAFYTDSSVAVRMRALMHLVRRNAFDGRQDYIERGLRDPSAELRAGSARLGALLPHRDALALLGRELNARDGSAPEELLDTLADLVERDVAGSVDLLRQYGTTIQFYARLAGILDRCTGTAATAALEELATYAAAEVRLAAVEPLVRRLGSDAWPMLDRALRDASPSVRARAVRAIGSGINLQLAENTPRLLAALTRAHMDPNAEVRSRTAVALARTSLPCRNQYLQVLEGDADERVSSIARKAREELDRAGRQPTVRSR